VCSSFTASPTSLFTGSPTTLAWQSTGAVSASIDNGVGTVQTNGALTVYPAVSTTYTLLLKNTPGTSASCAAPKVTVKAALPTCDSFTISSSTITAGGKTTLKWATTNVTKVTISNLTGTLPVDGSTSTAPTVNTSYVLTAYNADNATTSCKVSVTVVPSVTAGARIVRTIKVNGLDREYIVHMPKVLNTTNTPYQAMVVFHPATAVDTFMEQNAPFYADPKGKNLVVIYPQGYQKTWNVGGCCGVAGNVGVDDVAFFQKVLADVKTLIPIREKAYISGFSNGSLMVYRLVCDVPNLVSAAVPFAGAMAMDSCTKTPTVPMLHLNGTEDPITLSPETADPNGPYANSLTVLVNPYTTLDAVAKRNGCTTKRSPSAGITAWGATCEAYSCTSTSAAKTPVNICLIPGLGHAWPGSGDSNSTSSSTDLSGYGPYLPDLNPTGPVLDFLLKY
jgi:polyhydroxybutyrate depolymerase